METLRFQEPGSSIYIDVSQVTGGPYDRLGVFGRDYIPTADRWLDEHEHDLRAVYRDVPKRQILSIIIANTLLGLEHTDV